jgi:uncharacterized membrane protein YbhN (UPF0104 family)
LFLGNVDPFWLVAGVGLHLGSQVMRGRGWHSVVCAAHAGEDRPRRRDVMAAWMAGAGASGVLSARGGDVVRIALLRRRMRTSCPALAGTLAAETVAETGLGAMLTAWAISAGLLPGLRVPGAGTAALIVAGLVGVILMAHGLARRCERVRRAAVDARRGLAVLACPRAYLTRVLPWGIGSRALRLCSLACFLAAFGLPVTLTAALAVMVTHSGGRLVPFSPAGTGASLGMLAVGFPAVTGASVTAGQLATFYLGMTGVLTIVGVALSTLILVQSLGFDGARRTLTELRPKPRPAGVTAP